VHSEVRVTGRSQVTFELAAGTGSKTFRLSAAEGGLAVRHDPRILNFRVFRCRWRKGCGRDESAHTDAGQMGPIHTDTVVPDRKSSSEPAGIISGAPSLTAKMIGVLRRAAFDGPVITIWVPVPRLASRVLRLILTPPQTHQALPAVPREAPRPPTFAKPVDAVEPPPSRPTTAHSIERPVYLHTNACGDFTLMARERWFDLRGYPEWDMYSFHIDSVLCYAAHHGGAREVVLKEPLRIYHIEHGHGSGWTPEGEGQLFERLRARGVPWLEYEDLAAWTVQMRRLDCPMIFNQEGWGLGKLELREATR